LTIIDESATLAPVPGKRKRKKADAGAAARERRLVTVLRALSDGTRLRIFGRIAAVRGPVCVGDLTGRFPVSQPTVSHHLKVLREAGLVTVSRRGTWSYWEPAPGGLAVLRRALGELEAPGRAPGRGRGESR
jgi:ArsR family transcriptional regulator, arsenate/arsenite/antimonite-responsive transcriptional repressor